VPISIAAGDPQNDLRNPPEQLPGHEP
jgi:hypothetical protein